MMNIDEIWSKTRILLETKMTKEAYSVWLGHGMFPYNFENGKDFILCIRDTTMIPIIKKRYLSIIQNAVEDAVGHSVTVSFISPDYENPPYERKIVEPLHSEYTFENFIVTDNNQQAFTAAFSVAEEPGKVFNPLFIYGPVSAGKTHLCQAIYHYIHDNFPCKKTIHMTVEEYVDELLDAIQHKRTQKMRDYMHMADVLIMDDFDRIGSRELTQQEFFNLFNDLFNENKQIVIASRKAPKDLRNVNKLLCARMEWGRIVEIQ